MAMFKVASWWSIGSVLAVGAIVSSCATHRTFGTPSSGGEAGQAAGDESLAGATSAGGLGGGASGVQGGAGGESGATTFQGGGDAGADGGAAGADGGAAGTDGGSAGNDGGPDTPHFTTLSLLAGALGAYCEHADGVGAEARFCSAASMAWDGASLYVADHQSIRKVSVPNGAVATLDLRLTGGSSAAVIALDTSSQTLYVAMAWGTIHKISLATLQETDFVGAPSNGNDFADGKGGAAVFGKITALVPAANGELFVLDAGNQLVRHVDADGNVTTLAGTRGATVSKNGTGAAAAFRAPVGMAEYNGVLYVSDKTAIRAVDATWGVVTTIAGSLTEGTQVDDTGDKARFDQAGQIAGSGGQMLWVADAGTLRTVSLVNNSVVTFAGSPGVSELKNGTGSAAHFLAINSIIFDRVASVFLADGNTIRKVGWLTANVSTLAGAPYTFQNGDANGTGDVARFWQPSGIAADAAGRLFVADTKNELIRQVDGATGDVTTVAGYPGSADEKDGTAGEARFFLPMKAAYASAGVATDATGHVFVADSQGETIRQIVASSGDVTTLAGFPKTQGAADGNGPDARFTFPSGVTSDGAGNLYIVEPLRNSIRKLVIASKGVTTLTGGNPPGNVDGAKSVASFNMGCLVDATASFGGVAYDGAGQLYVSDCGNAAIRRVDVATGAVTTVTGSPDTIGSKDGSLAEATFTSPLGIAFTRNKLYVADAGAATLRMIDLAKGTVSTLAGIPGQVAVSLGALPARLACPTGVAVLPNGNIAVTDAAENAVLLVH